MHSPLEHTHNACSSKLVALDIRYMNVSLADTGCSCKRAGFSHTQISSSVAPLYNATRNLSASQLKVVSRTLLASFSVMNSKIIQRIRIAVRQVGPQIVLYSKAVHGCRLVMGARERPIRISFVIHDRVRVLLVDQPRRDRRRHRSST